MKASTLCLSTGRHKSVIQLLNLRCFKEDILNCCCGGSILNQGQNAYITQRFCQFWYYSVFKGIFVNYLNTYSLSLQRERDRETLMWKGLLVFRSIIAWVTALKFDHILLYDRHRCELNYVWLPFISLCARASALVMNRHEIVKK